MQVTMSSSNTALTARLDEGRGRLRRLLGLLGRLGAAEKPHAEGPPGGERTPQDCFNQDGWYDAVYNGSSRGGVMITGSQGDGSHFFAYLP